MLLGTLFQRSLCVLSHFYKGVACYSTLSGFPSIRTPFGCWKTLTGLSHPDLTESKTCQSQVQRITLSGFSTKEKIEPTFSIPKSFFITLGNKSKK